MHAFISNISHAPFVQHGVTIRHNQPARVTTHIGIGTKKEGLTYTIYFGSDKKYIACPLRDDEYGPGHVDFKGAVTKGWVFLLPTAKGESVLVAPTVAGGARSPAPDQCCHCGGEQRRTRLIIDAGELLD